MARLTDKVSIAEIAASDLVHIVDTSDTTGSPEGTSKKLSIAQLISSLGIQRNVAVEYNNATVVEDVDYDTGVTATGRSSTSEFSVIANISAGGNTFAVFEQITASALLVNPDIRVGRSATFPSVTGSANMITWYDSVTETIHIEVSLDGGGKTLESLQVVSAENVIQLTV